ncbi:MAG TPA: Xaa-Pro peptidase family protein [Actinomycetota bacterium]|nr:Xaa-Pro peptidase family protein [Actinomycetota bacterium]
MTGSRHADRRHRAGAAAEAAGLSGLLVTPGPDLRYLTGYEPPPLERLTLLIVARGRAPRLLVPALEEPRAAQEPGMSGVEVVAWRDGEDPYRVAAASLGGGPYAITDQTWAAHLLELERAVPGCRFVASGHALPLLRAVKDDAEIEALRAAARAADEAFAEVVSLPFAGRRELDVAADLERLLRERGHDRVGFTIVGSGPNGASPHHESGERVIAPTDAVVMDFGGRASGYHSDITRTVFVGEPDEEQRRVYDVVRAAQQAAFEAVRPGVEAQDVDRAARAVIEQAGFGDRFLHRTGHGIGLEVHEPPYIVEGNETPLEAGMTFSDEPGIYLAGRFGVRIEDQVVVTVAGAERLNVATREPVVVS